MGRTADRIANEFTDGQRLALVEGDVDKIEDAMSQLLRRLNALIGLVFTLTVAIFTAVLALKA